MDVDLAAIRIAVRDRLTPSDASPPTDELATIFEHVLELARDHGATPVQRDVLGGLAIELEALGSLAPATTPGHPIIARAVSVSGTRVCRDMVELAVDLLGADAQLRRPQAPYDGLWPDLELATRPARAALAHNSALLSSVAEAIGNLNEASDHLTDIYLGDLAGEIGAIRSDIRARLARGAPIAWEEIAARGWTGLSAPREIGGSDLDLRAESVLLEELARAVSPGPAFSTIGVIRPALEGETLARVVNGEESWTLPLTPLVPDLDSATRVAIVGGDGIWELEGGERALFETYDATRPLGMVIGGDAGARIADSTLLPQIRTRTLAVLAAEACGVGLQALELARADGASGADEAVDLLLGRALAYRAAALVAAGSTGADAVAGAAKAKAVEAAIAACMRAGTSDEADRLSRRALWLKAWEVSGATVRAELASALLDLGEG